jgi:AraC-like DNA-binding protein
VEAGPGDVITVNPGEVHDGAPIGDEGRAWRMLYFDPPLVGEVVRDVTDGRTSAYEFADPVIRGRRLALRVARLFRQMTAEPGAALRRDGLMFGVLSAAMAERTPLEPSSSAPASIRRAQSLIDDDPTAAHSLADLARTAGLSRFQLLRGFVRSTGLTPHAYLVQKRTDMARRLITGGASLAEAAAGCGFADQSHMTRAFVRKYGLTPGAWARAVG